MPGPAPKPTALRVLNGKAGHRPINKREPKPKLFEEAPPAPGFLTPEGRAEWDRVTPYLVAAGILTTIDTGVLCGYCNAYGQAEVALRAIAHMRENDPIMCGLMVRSAKNNPMANPMIGILNVAFRELNVYAQQLGMTPSARSRIRATDAVADSDNPFLVLKQSG